MIQFDAQLLLRKPIILRFLNSGIAMQHGDVKILVVPFSQLCFNLFARLQQHLYGSRTMEFEGSESVQGLKIVKLCSCSKVELPIHLFRHFWCMMYMYHNHNAQRCTRTDGRHYFACSTID